MAEAGYLIGEEGALTGVIIRFEEGTSWVIGRDPDVADWVLEDPKVSRKHMICKLLDGQFVLENLSVINPATKNGKVMATPTVLKEADVIHVGDTFFRFSKRPYLTEEAAPTFTEDLAESLSPISIDSPLETRWIIKVITGPNTGAEFHMNKGKTYVLGKDPILCDIILQDVSVSRQHARMSINDVEEVTIEDLRSKNGTLVNKKAVTEQQKLKSGDLVMIGTTSFLVIDCDQTRETLVSETIPLTIESGPIVEKKSVKNWSEVTIPKKYLFFISAPGLLLLALLIGVILLFQGKTAILPHLHEGEQIVNLIKSYPSVQYSYIDSSGQLFLTGHVITTVEKQELLYQLKALPFLKTINDNVVIDEYVWNNINALLMANSNWQGVSIHSTTAGRFIIGGYVATLEQAQALTDYLNINFPYLDRLENQVIIEANLKMEVDSLLLAKGFNNIQYHLSDGEIVLSGYADGKEQYKLELLIKKFKSLPGVRVLKNYVIYTTHESALVDLSDKYKVMGYSKKDGENQFVVINGKILALGDSLDGMTILQIFPTLILLEKDGLKFKINYNLQ